MIASWSISRAGKRLSQDVETSSRHSLQDLASSLFLALLLGGLSSPEFVRVQGSAQHLYQILGLLHRHIDLPLIQLAERLGPLIIGNRREPAEKQGNVPGTRRDHGAIGVVYRHLIGHHPRRTGWS